VSRPEKADIEELKTQFYRLLDAVLARALARAKPESVDSQLI